jgi:hypothetical protein
MSVFILWMYTVLSNCGGDISKAPFIAFTAIKGFINRQGMTYFIVMFIISLICYLRTVNPEY